jgi:hypothetical protein
MAQSLIIESLVKQTSSTTGSTGNLTFATTVSGFRAFSAVVADGIPFPYVAKGATASEWEEGIGVTASSGTQLVRRVIKSSNGNDAVSFTTGPITITLSRHDAIVGNECIWGHGNDGALSVAGSNIGPLTEDKHYTSITWTGSGKILTNGYRVFCIGETNLTSAPAGGISNDASGVTGGGWGSVGGGINGQVGGAPIGSIPPAPAAILGGKGGDDNTAGEQAYRNALIISHLPPFERTCGIPAGGGGGTDSTNGAHSGGGGAGVVELWSRRLRRTSGTATGAIRANGADGTTNGAGGGGGRVRVGYDELLGSAKTGALQANGGTGITGSNDGGDGGFIEVYNMRAGSSSFTAGTTTTSTAAGTCSQNL